MKRLFIFVLLGLLMVLCTHTALALEAPVVTMIPENPTSTSWVIFRFDKVYDEVKFSLTKDGKPTTGGRDSLDDTDFDWGTMEAGSYHFDAQARTGNTWSEHFVMDFTVTPMPFLPSPVVVSCPETVRFGEPFEVVFKEVEHATAYGLSLGTESNGYFAALGFDNPEGENRIVFNDWPDQLEPGVYRLRLSAWGDEQYDSSRAITTWDITVEANNRPAAPQSITMNGEAQGSVKKNEENALEVLAPGATAVRFSYEFRGFGQDHTRSIATDENGACMWTFFLSESESYAVGVKAYGLYDGVWSLPLSVTFPVEDVVVSGQASMSMDSLSVPETEHVMIRLDRTYNRFHGILKKNGEEIRSATAFLGDTLYIGPLEPGEYTVTGRGLVDHVWTEEASISFTVNAVERLDQPVLTGVPESIPLGSGFNITLEADARARYSTLFLNDEQGNYIGFAHGTDSIFYYLWPDDAEPGTYVGRVRSFGNDITESKEAVFSFTVTDHERPAAPASVTVEPQTPKAGSSVTFIFDQTYEAIALELYESDGSRYSGTDCVNSDRITWPYIEEGEWIAHLSVCVDGIYSGWTQVPFTAAEGDAPSNPEVHVHYHEPIQAGWPVTVWIDPVEGMHWYGARISDMNGNMIADGGNGQGVPFLIGDQGNLALDAGTYILEGWITGFGRTWDSDPITITVTGEKPSAPTVTAPATVGVDEVFKVTASAENASLYELFIARSGESEPVFFSHETNPEWSVSLPASGVYTVKAYVNVEGAWSKAFTGSIRATSEGKLPDPAVASKGAFALGEAAEFTFSAEGAESFTWELVMGGNYYVSGSGETATGKLTLSEAQLDSEGGYTLTVKSCKAGWDSGETRYDFTVGNAPAKPTITVSKDTVTVHESFDISFDLHGAESFICDVQYDPSDPGSMGGFSGSRDQLTWVWDFDLPGKHFIRAYSEQNGIPSAWAYAYVNCTAAGGKQLTIPASVTVIESEAFMSLAVEGIRIPEGCRKVESKAFADCKQLKVVEIPGMLTEVAPDAFEGSPVETIITPEGSAAESVFSGRYQIVHP